MGRIKIKSDGRFFMSDITTESGEQIPCTDLKIEKRGTDLYAILTVRSPILEIETENYEVIDGNRSRNKIEGGTQA